MATGHRLTIRSIDTDPRIRAITTSAAHLGVPPIGELRVADVVLIDADLDDAAKARLAAVLVDPLLQYGSWDTPDTRGVEVTGLAGVTNSDADAVQHAARVVDVPIRSAGTATRFEFDDDVSVDVIDDVISRLVANPIVERWAHGTVDMNLANADVAVGSAEVVAIRWLDDDALMAVDRSRSLSLDLEELRVIREHFEKLDRDPTDLELETLAQTWSEHCAHKTFRAAIELHDGDSLTTIEPLMRQLRNSTESLDRPFVRSAFVGNAGVVEFTPGTTIAVKAETHNHPSAVEPFGGANTGVGGVIRDVLGMAAPADRGHRRVVLRPRIAVARRTARRVTPSAPYSCGRRRRGGRLRQQDRPADHRRSGPLRPGVHHQPVGVRRLYRRRTCPSDPRRPVPR